MPFKGLLCRRSGSKENSSNSGSGNKEFQSLPSMPASGSRGSVRQGQQPQAPLPAQPVRQIHRPPPLQLPNPIPIVVEHLLDDNDEGNNAPSSGGDAAAAASASSTVCYQVDVDAEASTTVCGSPVRLSLNAPSASLSGGNLLSKHRSNSYDATGAGSMPSSGVYLEEMSTASNSGAPNSPDELMLVNSARGGGGGGGSTAGSPSGRIESPTRFFINKLALPSFNRKRGRSLEIPRLCVHCAILEELAATAAANATERPSELDADAQCATSCEEDSDDDTSSVLSSSSSDSASNANRHPPAAIVSNFLQVPSALPPGFRSSSLDDPRWSGSGGSSSGGPPSVASAAASPTSPGSRRRPMLGEIGAGKAVCGDDGGSSGGRMVGKQRRALSFDVSAWSLRRRLS